MPNNDDSQTRAADPVIRELWAVKDAMAADCGHDVAELFRRIGARHRALERQRVSSSRLPQETGADRNPGTN